MGRNRIRRQVFSTPAVKGFRTFGRIGGPRRKIILSLDEFESLRLLDYENHTQEEAAALMKVSRPTLTRIYTLARHKLAAALVEGANLLIEGGDISLKQHVWLCEDCGQFTETDAKHVFHCPSCGSPHIISLDECYQNQCPQCKKCYRGGGNARI